jgi:hypothetical protein
MPGRIRLARTYLARALDIDPLDFQTYVALDRSRNGASDYPTANDLSTLQVARDLAPQSFDVRLRYARALMTRERYLEAAGLLGPVANSPHAAPQRAQARTMLAEARTRAGLGVEDEGEAPPDETPAGEAVAEGAAQSAGA